MTDELTSTGLAIDDLQTRRARKVAALRAGISSVLDVSADTPIGQLVDISNEHDQQLAELLQEIYSAFDPEQATNQSLDALCSITGTYRREATKGTVTLKLNLDAATTVSSGSQAAVSGDPDNIWVTTEDVTSVGAGDYTVPAEAAEAGDIEAPAGTITVIVTPVGGWNSVTNDDDATPGLERELDSELRQRRASELAIGGSTTVDAIQAQVSALDGVEQAICTENDNWYASGGLPPNSVEVVYWDGSGSPSATVVANVAEAIYETKAGGVRAYGTDTDGAGTTSETVTDDQGNSHTIGFTLAAEQEILVDITVVQDAAGPTVTTTAVEDAILAWASSALTIGEDVYRSKVIAAAADVSGVEDVPLATVLLAISPAGTAASDVTIGARQIATIDRADINVTVT
jgi:uncharacterized phage protein gp47/JayE